MLGEGRRAEQRWLGRNGGDGDLCPCSSTLSCSVALSSMLFYFFNCWLISIKLGTIRKGIQIQLYLPRSGNLSYKLAFFCSPSALHALAVPPNACTNAWHITSTLGISVLPVDLIMGDRGSLRTIWCLEEDTFKKLKSGTSLLAQGIRLCAPNAGGPGSIPGQGTRSHMCAATKSSHATTKEPACCN